MKATNWHDDYIKFRGGLKDLEVMVQNVINSAFTTVITVQEGVDLLEVFFHLTSREVCARVEREKEREYLKFFSLQSIKRVVDRRTVDLFVMFNEELNLVKKEFNRQSPSLTPFQPHYAGMATWARSLKKRIDTPMKVGMSHSP